MKLDVYFTLREAEAVPLEGTTVVVVDVIRATTAMVEALAAGAREIYPTRSTEEAVKLASSLGREDTLLAGERKGVKVEGFDLGNSPREFTPETVAGKRLVWSTSNGTAALAAAQEGGRVLAAGFTNLSAVAESVANAEHVVVLCAGREDRFAIEDALCAGHLAERLREAGTETVPNDAAVAALALAHEREPTVAFLSGTAAGKVIREIGLEGDLEVCADVDRHGVVVEMQDQALQIVR